MLTTDNSTTFTLAETSVLKTLAYFDIFQYPLTLAEIWRYSLTESPISWGDLCLAVGKLEGTHLQQQDGFYFLKGQAAHVALRQRRYLLAFKKFTKAKKVIKILACLPFVRSVFICNSLALSNSRPESDIDLFVITSPGHLFSSRFLVTLFLKIFHLRPQKNNAKDKICPSFFISQDAPSLQALALPKDMYFFYWVASLVPIYCSRQTITKLFSRNIWIKKLLSNFYPYQTAGLRQVRPAWPLKKLKKSAEKLLETFDPEPFLKKWQMAHFPKEIACLLNVDTRVVASDTILKFHVNDRRAFYQECFENKLKELGLI